MIDINETALALFHALLRKRLPVEIVMRHVLWVQDSAIRIESNTNRTVDVQWDACGRMSEGVNFAEPFDIAAVVDFVCRKYEEVTERRLRDHDEQN